MHTTNKEYWHTNYPYLLLALTSITNEDEDSNADDLAYIAGDYMNMTDDEIISTLINEYTQFDEYQQKIKHSHRNQL